MRLTDLLGSKVVGRDGRSVGVVTDVRLVQDGPMQGEFGGAFRVHGLVIGRTTIGAHMGFERANVRGPWLLKRIFASIQGTPRYAGWDLVRSIETDLVRLRENGEALPKAEPPR
ncbi:MAG: PRC-barrel domain-containing protein [Actinomycetota bacterium]